MEQVDEAGQIAHRRTHSGGGEALAGGAARRVSDEGDAQAPGGGIGCVVAVALLALRWRGFARYDARAPEA